MLAPVLRPHQESPRTQVLCATALAALSVGSFLCLIAGVLGRRWAPHLSDKDYDMLLKVLGFVCAGVFIGATLLEVKQIRLGKKKHPDEEEQEQEQEPAASADEEA